MGVFLFNCPHCGKQIGAQDEWEGKMSMCPHCQKTVIIRRAAPEQPPMGVPGEGQMPPQPTLSAWGDYDTTPEICQNAKNSMWFGICGFCCCQIFGVIAIVLGIIGLNEISTSNGKLEGRSYAWTGIILGALQITLTVINFLCIPYNNNGFMKLFDRFKDTDNHMEQYEERKEMPIRPLPEPKDTEKPEKPQNTPQEERNVPLRQPDGLKPDRGKLI